MKFHFLNVLYYYFLTQQTLEGLPQLPGLENGPGFDSQGSVNFFTKYCFPNLHRIHVKAFEVEDCEFVPVHHQPKAKFYSTPQVKKKRFLPSGESR